MQNNYTNHNNFQLNGFVVTTQEPQNYIMARFRYRGVAYGRAWPLEEISPNKLTSEDVELTNRVHETIMSRPYIGNSYPLGLVPDIRLIERYYQRCVSINIPVRILLIATPHQSPVIDEITAENLDQKLLLLGFDYVSTDFSYSAVVDDLNPPFSPEVDYLVAGMNKYGLFTNSSSLKEYIVARWDFARSSGKHQTDRDGLSVSVSPVEDDIELVPCKVYQADILA